jgi:iron complex transport system ATP-binding protein
MPADDERAENAWTAEQAEELRATDLAFSYGGREVLGGVSIVIARGELVGVLGPNGSGKTTLLRCLMGFLKPRSGRVTLGGHDLGAWPRRAFARQVAAVPQEMPTDFPLQVRELVLLGRLPHLPAHGLGFESPRDRAAADHAMAAAAIGDLAERPIHQLSGGELRRAFVARALAQEAPFLLLDEPTAGLDLRHQLAILELVRRRARGRSGILVVLHDVNLAAAYCDRVVLLKEGRVVAEGTPDQALAPAIVSEVYGVELEAVAIESAGRRLLVPRLRASEAPE